jgi:hypothetical protein
VPADFVPTPNGWFHPSCVIETASGETYDPATATLHGKDGSARTVAPCAYPAYRKNGDVLVASTPTGTAVAGGKPTAASAATNISGWVIDAENGGDAPAVSLLQAQWQVPSSPPSSGGLIYLFLGMQDYTLLQAVLTYWYGWTAGTWDCCYGVENQNILHSTAIAVEPGDWIYGLLQGSGCSIQTGECQSWLVYAYDYATGQASEGSVSSTGQYGYYWQLFGPPGSLYAGALQAYYVNSCGQMPASGINFQNVTANMVVTDGPMPASYLGWSIATPAPGASNCSPSGSVSSSGNYASVSLSWND